MIDVPADSPTDEAVIRQYVADVGGEVWKTPAPRVDFCARCHKLLDVHQGLGVCPCCVDYDGASPPALAGLACSSTPLMLRADFRTRCISVSSPLLLPAEPLWRSEYSIHPYHCPMVICIMQSCSYTYSCSYMCMLSGDRVVGPLTCNIEVALRPPLRSSCGKSPPRSAGKAA